jgi:multidrug efflux pump
MIGPNLSAWSLKHRSLVIFLMAVAIVAGSLAFVKLGRAEDPPFTTRTMVVAASWPGATVEETMLQVTERLERKLQETRNLDSVRSYTTAGFTTIFVDLKQSTPAKEVDGLFVDVRNNIGDIGHTLPRGVIGPFFNSDFGDTFGTIYGFVGEGFSHRELRDYVEAARSRLLLVPDVSKIELLGEQDEQIFLEFSPARLAGLGLNFPQLVGALQEQNLVRPSGVIHNERERVTLRTSGAFDSERDLEAVNFSINGRIIRLGDIASIRRGLSDPPQPMFRVNGKPAIGLAISMRDSGDILALGANLRRELADIRKDLPVGVEPIEVTNQAEIVDDAIADFMTSLWQSILIIGIASFVALGLRPGSVVAMSIPLTLAIVFAVMNIVGIDLQRISLGALIIALTLLVDDAMTTIDAMIRRLAAGDSKEVAATFAYKNLAAPMLIGTLVTIAGFVPIGFAKSSAGEYTFSIFAVVAISLLVSWLVAVIFAPLIGLAILKVPDKKPDAEPAPPGKLLRLFAGFLNTAITLRWLTIAITLAMFAASLYAIRFVPRQFFPSSDRVEVMVDLRLPQGSSIFQSEQVAKRVEAALEGDKDVARFSTYVGRGAIRFYLPLDVQFANPFFAQMVIDATDLEARLRLEAKLRKLLAEEFPDVIARVAPLELGPPVGWPIQYRVSGPDIEEVRRIALEVSQVVGGEPNTRLINFDWMEPARQLRIRVDQDEARQLGLSSRAVASALNAAVTGTVVTQVRDDIYLVDVVARATDDQRTSFGTLRSLQVPLPNGRMVALSQFARIEEEQEYPLIWRRDRVPTLTVQGDVVPGVLPAEVVSNLAPRIAELAAKLPPHYTLETGGIEEESGQSQASVFAVVPLMIVLMLTILMVQLVSFRRLAMVVGVLPMGMIGVVGALLLFNRPLGFVAILGVLALIGMIAKNAVILIVQIEEDRKSMKVREAVLAAASSRLRPMLLTALSTVLGLIPIAPTVFWGPMAFAIMGGLMVATLLTLVFLPAVYVAVFEREDSKPKAEAVDGAVRA